MLIYDTIQAQCKHTTYQFMHSTHIQQTARLFTIINKAGHRPFRVPRVDQTRTRSRMTSAQTDQHPATLSAVYSNSIMHSTTARSYTCWVVLPSLGGPIVAIQTDQRPATLSGVHSNSTMHSTTAWSYTCWGVLHLVGWSYPHWVVL